MLNTYKIILPFRQKVQVLAAKSLKVPLIIFILRAGVIVGAGNIGVIRAKFVVHYGYGETYGVVPDCNAEEYHLGYW